MIKSNTQERCDMNLNTMTQSQLFDYYKTIAGRANKRLERLEKAGMTSGSAYKRAMRTTSTTQVRKSSGRRFSTAKPANIGELRKRVREVESFLGNVTSTPGGVRKVSKKIARTIKERYGLDLSPDQVAQTFDSGLWQKLNERYGSSTAVQILAETQKSAGNMKKVISGLSEQNQYVSEGEWQNIEGVLIEYRKDKNLSFLYQ